MSIKKQLLQDIARFVYEEGITDFQLAKKKVMENSPIARADIPGNDDVFQAIKAYAENVAREDNQRLLQTQRHIALEAMQFFAEYEPVVTDYLAAGVASPHLPINMHLFASSPEEVIFFLEQENIPYRLFDARLNTGKDFETFMGIRFFVDDTELELIVFSLDDKRKFVQSSVTGEKVKRLNKDKFNRFV
jgi:hypothetical protein